MTTYEKIVKGATKLKVAAPKPKYIEPILMATSMDHQVSSENLATIVKTLHQRLQDNSWSVVYKSLLVFHIMIREGDRDVTLKYLSERSPNIFKISGSNIANGSVFNTDARFIVKYSRYLQSRVDNFAATRVDYVRDERINNSINQSGGRLRNLKIERGLLRECESVQSQIDALLKNSFLEAEIKNDIILTAFRLLVNDLLALFQEMNEGVINLLEHYFEMSYVDAERALSVYKKFVDQTKYVIDYLRVAKHLEYATKLHVPTIKHAPTALTSSLEEYLHDPAFEQHRSEYIIKKKQGLNSDKPVSSPLEKSGVGPKQQQQQQQQQLQQQQHLQQQQLQQQQLQQQQLQQQQLQQQQQMQQQQMQQQQLQQQQFQQQQQPGLQVQQHPNQIQQIQQQQQQQAQSELQRRGTLLVQQTAINPWGNSMPASFTNNNPQFLVNQANTGAGFGNGQPAFSAPQQQAQTTGNPFAVSMPQPVIQQYTGFQQPTPNSGTWNAQLSPSQPIERQNTNPFAALSSTATGNQPQVDKTNPFGGTRFSNANTTTFTFQQGNTPDKASVTATGSNPFKVSNTTTKVFDSAYQKTESQPLKPQPTAGGLENLPTLAVFPETQREQSRNTYIANAQQNLASQATGQFNQQYEGQMQYQQPQIAQMTQGQYSNQPMPQQTGIYNGPSLI